MHRFRMQRQLDWRLLSVGIACLLVAVTAGNVEIAGNKLPGVASLPRQLIVGAIGLAFIVASAFLTTGQDEAELEAPAPSPEQEQRNRTRMLERVRIYWIRGVLEQSIHQLARIELGLQKQPNAVAEPWRLVLQQQGQTASTIPAGTPISQVFDELDKALLILGAPGAGKTTLLLEIAQVLLGRAEQDPAHPMPVVFSLASWTRRRPLSAWLVAELHERYDVPAPLAKRWINDEKVAPLLDGLDEVKPEHRDSCVEAINAFRQEHGFLPLAVCSRTGDYLELTRHLRLHGAIEVQPLTRQQVNEYLRQAGKPLAGVRAALRDDPVLWELLESPLLLSVVALAYQNKSAAAVRATGTLAERRTHLFEAYTAAMFDRRVSTRRYPPHLAILWLKSLATNMQRHNQSVLYVEWIQPTWLLARWRRMVVVYGPGLLLGFIVATTGTAILVVPAPTYVLQDVYRSLALFAGILGLPIFLLAYGKEIRPAEELQWSWKNLRASISTALVRSIAIVVILVPVVSYIVVWDAEDSTVDRWGQSAILSIMLALCVAVIFILLGGVTSQLSSTRTIPNQGIKRSARNAIWIGLVVFSLVALPTLLFVRTYTPLWLGLGLWLALAVGLQVGGRAYLQHVLLRYQLALQPDFPRSLIPFLRFSVDRLLLRQVGGGFAFTHRLLLEHFAGQALHSEALTSQAQRPVVGYVRRAAGVLATIGPFIVIGTVGIMLLLSQIWPYSIDIPGQLPSGTAIFSDDFRTASKTWRWAADESTTLAHTTRQPGEMRIIIDGPSITREMLLERVERPLVIDNVRIDASVASLNEIQSYVQIVCRRQNSGDGYEFVFSSSGGFAIFKVQNEEYQALAGWTTINELTDGGIRLQVACVHEGDSGAVRLMLWANGRGLAQVMDRHPLPPGKVGIGAYTTDTGKQADIAFTSFSLWRL